MQPSLRWAIAGVTVIILLAAAVAVMLAIRLRAPRVEAVDIPTWVETTCGAEAEYAAAIARTFDNVDPSTLELAARKERAARLGKAEIEAAQQVARVLSRISPPESARPFHEALIRDAEEEVNATREQLDAIAKAATPQQIAVANAQVRFRRDSSTQNLDAAFRNLTPDVLAALSAEPSCAGAILPGAGAPGAPPPGTTPPRPVPTGSSRGPA